MNPGKNVEISMVGTLAILVALDKRKIGQGYSKSGICFGRPFMSAFLAIGISLVIKKQPKR